MAAALVPPTGFTVASQPLGVWYYILAICDLDGVSTKNSQYFQSSTDTVIQKLDHAT